MERTTFSISYYCRKSKATTRGLAPIEVSLIVNGKRTFINLPRKIEPETFEKLYNQKKTNELKDYLNVYTQKIYQIQKELMLSGIPITAHTIKEYIKTGGVKTYTLEDLFNDFIEVQKKRNPNVIRKYIITFDLLLSQHDKNKQAITITSKDAHNFYLSLQNKYEQSTLSGYITRIKSIFNFGVEIGKLKTNPFGVLKNISKGEKDIEALTQKEIDTIVNTEIKTEYLERARHLFIFQLHTGLAYIDMAQLTKEDVQIENNTYYIIKKRQKTKKEFCTILLPPAIKVWEYYNGALPIITNQRYNIYLKAIGAICNIDKKLHTHLARHSFATLLLNRGCRLEVVSKSLGHSTLTQTSHYAKLLEKQTIKELSEYTNNL